MMGTQPGDDILFHGTPLEIDIEAVYPLTHFGTFKAAWMRVGEVLYKRGWQFYPELREDQRDREMSAFIYPVRLRMSNPCRINDGDDVFHTPTEIGGMLRSRGVIGEAEEAALRCNNPAPILLRILKERGYDGLVYKNQYEDTGSQSYMVLDASQVSLAGSVLRTSLGEILDGGLKEVSPSLFEVEEIRP